MEPWIGLFRLRADDETLAEEHGWEADKGGYAWFAALASDYQGFVEAVRDAVARQGLRIDDVADAEPLATRGEQESLSPLVTGLASAAEATGGVWSGTWHLYPLGAPDEEEPLEIDKFVEDEDTGIRYAHRVAVDEPSSDLLEEEEGARFAMEADPYRNLPPPLVEALERFILIPEWRVALSRMVALWTLLGEVWPRPRSAEPERREWIEAHRGRSLQVGVDDHGHYVLSDETARERLPDADLPAELVDLMVREVLDRPEDERVIRRDSVQDLLVEWNRCLVDPEKLTGHLLLGHEDRAQIAGERYEELVRRHSELHLSST
jgi:hypothetical protein